MIKYDKFFELMKANGYTATIVKEKNLIPQGTYYKIKNNTGTITVETIDKICRLLKCQPADIMEYVPDEPMVEVVAS